MLVNARNRSVGIEGGRIVDAAGRFDIVIDCPDADARPGLINAHDHLHRNHYGRLGAGTYPNAYRWAEDIQVRYRRCIANGWRLPRREALLAGAWKNLFSGVTTVVHHDAWEADFDRVFPIRVARLASADSLGMSGALEAPAAGPFGLHVAEGIDAVAAGEVADLGQRGLLDQRLIAVHGVGIDASGVTQFHRAGSALVWCPTSNNFLFGRTAPAPLLEGADVLLGSDSRLTGAGDLLDELRAARALQILDDERLADAVGGVCARRLGLPEPSLEPGSSADLILLGRPLAQARSADVALTVVAGVPRVARLDLARQLGVLAGHGTKMRVGGVVRWTNRSVDQLIDRRIAR
jgi:cytosine/adenosine deaminase-related metal-dependent hydrolase